ncbi:Na+/H+ antiporter NhaC family protein [Rheinheimera aquimaris]|jgi:Na+/H+ antiporter NhaC|uniref:Na+/H+ antiporter NhaC family protein n=1 Tax=Rheinheimera aquimaris TaxID=412437 RepID=UPI000E831552|nr:Na+/H+ antiporter NhaC family protein [Rheinheimera aquimaris]MCD1598805.1 Na+/H+ antiporter NhaC family protein [Rheinheimera aquimaris]HBN90864.1 sodium:proton antiporter [Rheinheimera sp.]
MNQSAPAAKGAKRSLLPLLFFVALFLGTGLYLQSQDVAYAFYQLPGHVAIIPALILAVWLHRAPLQQSIDVMVKGAGNSNIITMCIIYLLAGAFASVATATGGVDAAVNAGLSLIPAPWLLPGLFAIAALISTAMGTSMGTIGALAPIAVGLAHQAGLDPALVAGVLLSGAMFGDNLSIISDTTIASTRTQGARMSDKFRENIKIALPAALLTLVLYALLASEGAPIQTAAVNWTGVVPYAAILILAVAGLNVFLVLLLGIALAALQGAWFADYQLAGLGKDIATGFANVQEIFILAMLVSALSEFIKQQGGLQWIADKIQQLVGGLKLAGNKAQQLAIAALAFISNLCIANNTVAIVLTGDVAKTLAEQHQISPRRSASLLDIFACISQGLVPYGAQALLLGASFGISPWQVVTQSYYCLLLLLIAVLTILLRKTATAH